MPDSHWIPCSERLPDDGETVLVYVPTEESEPVWPGYLAGSSWCWTSGSFIGLHDPTHWMPMPEPPGVDDA